MQVDADLYGAGKRRVVTIRPARCASDDYISLRGHQQPVGARLGEPIEPASTTLDRDRLRVEGGVGVLDIVVVDAHEVGQIISTRQTKESWWIRTRRGEGRRGDRGDYSDVGV